MAYCLLARDRAAGTVTVMTPASFDRSDDAVAKAQALVASGSLNPESMDVLILDLAVASRLAFVTLPAPIDEPVAEPLDLSPAAGVWETPAAAEESVEPVEEPQPEAEPQPEIAPDVEVAPSPDVDVTPEFDAEPERLRESPPVPMPEAAPFPWPEPAVPEPTADSVQPPPVGKTEAPGPVSIAEVTILEPLPVVELDVGSYEVSGELVLERYTCDDCVYANTCPKVGESVPAECGSFQWKAL